MKSEAKAQITRAATVAYQRYEFAREQLLPFASEPDTTDALTPSEKTLLGFVEGVWHADPEAIGMLRSYGKAISGVRRAHYSGDRAAALRVRLDRDRRRVLNNSHPALWVSEPPVLGGFGLRAEDGSLYNEDTLRFFRIVSLLRDAELLQDFQASTPRRTVWEIGGGWGGFAHYFKTLFPRVTYLISGPPSLLLLSATYVMTLFPEACVRFFHASDPDAFCRDWQTVDFAFAPETAVERLRPASVSLTVDLGVLEQMGASRIGDHVRRAFDLGCRYIVSTSSNRVPESASAVRTALERWYWPHPMSVPAYLVRRFALRSGTAFLGWKRLLA